MKKRAKKKKAAAPDYCSRCRRLRPLNPNRRCASCGREQAKASIRYNVQLPRFVDLIETWEDEALTSELAYLNAKIDALVAERQRRNDAGFQQLMETGQAKHPAPGRRR